MDGIVYLYGMITATEIEELLLSAGNAEQKRQLMRFFKTDAGSYGEGDEFIGLKVPQTRLVVKEAKGKVSLSEIKKLIYSKWHECRLAGFLLLEQEMTMALPQKRESNNEAKARRRDELAQFYLRHARKANNWDLVDMSCPRILGSYLIYLPEKIGILTELAYSDNLWEQRIAMVTNWMLIRHGIYNPALSVADILLPHSHDLIHKAVGWMLREIEKKDKDVLLDYLEKNYASMHRTTLRYAIEKFPENQRQYWLKR